MATLQILGGAASNYVWACRIALEEKGVAYEHVAARPHSPEIMAISPIGKIPVMRHGEVALYESKAICSYVDRVFPGPSIFPADAVGLALAEQWVSSVNTWFDPILMRQYALAYIFPGTPDNSPNRMAIDAALPKVEKALALLDSSVAKTGHLVGSSFTIADMFLLPIMHYMRRFPESSAQLGKLPALSAYIDRHMARPSVQRCAPPPPAK